MNEIINSYNKFDYQRSSNLLESALENIDTFSSDKKILIYQYGAFLAFHEGKTSQAAQFFWLILELDPTYLLDAVTTPPKLQTLFQKTKFEFLEEMNRQTLQMQEYNNAPAFPWRALVPGWEHWHRGYHTKAVIWGTSSMVSFAGMVISIIQTQEREEEYLQAVEPEEIRSSYDSYQAAYRRQFYFGYAFCVIWAFSQLDLVSFSHHKTLISSSIISHSTRGLFPHISITISIP